MRRLLERCLTKDPKQRLRDIADARDALATPLSGAPVAATAHGRIAWLPWALALLGLAAGAWGLTRGWLPASPIAPEPTLTRLTFDSGVTSDSVLSNDRRLLAYSSTRLGRADLDIWIQQAAGGQPLRLTDDPADDGDPDISPDGSQVVYRSERAGGGAYVVASLGGTARRVASEARNPRFSRDGGRIAYWTGQFRGGPGRSATYVLSLSGGTPTQVLEGFEVAQRPRWSPDGQSLLVLAAESRSADTAGPLDLWLVRLDGTPSVRTDVLDRPGWRRAVTFEGGAVRIGDWSETGLLVAVGGTLWSVPLDAATGASGEPQQLLFGGATVLSPTGTAGRRVAFSQGFTERVIELRALPPDASEGRAVQVYADGNRLTRRASVSSDGRHLVLERDGSGAIEIWHKDLRTGTQDLVLQVESSGPVSATVSPDGGRASYNQNRADVTGSPGTGHVVELAGGVPRQVCDGCTVWGFMPDSRRVIATIGDHIVRVLEDATESSTDLVYDTENLVDRPSVSPDGRWLAFRRQRDRRSKVFLGSATAGGGAAAVQIDEPTTTGRPAGWSPDSRVLYLLLDSDGFRCLWAQRVDPGTGRPVGSPSVARHLHDVVGVSTSFGNAISASGFVYEAMSMRASLWRLDWPER